MRHRFSKLFLIVFIAALLGGCGSDSGFDERTDFIVGEGAVQFVNMIPDSPNLIMLHGIQNSNIRFPFAEPIENRFEDRYDWRVVYLNNRNDDVTVIEGDDQVISEGVLSTFLLMGTFGNPSVQIIDTPLIAQADRPDGVADIWFAANVTGYDMFDIYLTELDADLSVEAPLVTVTTGTFTSLISVPAGENRQLRIMVAGTMDQLFDSGAIVIPEKSQDLFALVDDFGPDASEHVNVIRSLSIGRTVIRDRSQPGGARIGNFSAVTALDTSYAGTDLNDIPQNTRSAYFDTTFGEFPYTSSEDGAVIEETVHSIQPGQFATIYNFNDLSEDAETSVRSVIAFDNRRPVKQRSLLKFVNGSNEVVDLFVLRDGQSTNNTPPFLSDAPFASSLTSQVLAVPLIFLIRDASSNEEITRLTDTPLESETYTLLYTAEQQLLLLND